MEVFIDSLDYRGRGVAKVDGKVCFIKDALPSEIVEVEWTLEKKNYNVGIVSKYLKTSKERVTPKCPYYKQCGGCHLGHLSYEKQLEWKEEYHLNAFKKNLSSPFTHQKIVFGSPFFYRNKVTFHSDGKHYGFYQEESHKLIRIDRCLLLDERINERLSSLTRKEELRISNINDDIVTKDSKKKIRCQIGNRYYQVSIQSFFQVNYEITEKLYRYIYECVEKKHAKKLLDLYCGTGTIGIYVSDLVEEVLGIEIVKEAIADAKENKKINNVKNISFLCGDVATFIDKLKNQYDFIIVDPPRSGLAPKVLENIKKIASDYILYVSCNPATLIRDLKKLEESYTVESIQLFDMFPNTYHVESVCLLRKKKKSDNSNGAV